MSFKSPGKSLASAGVYLMFFASGTAALVYQVLWSRWLGLSFGNTTLSVSVVLAAFMCGLALGSAWLARRISSIANPMLWYAVMEAGIGVFALVFPWLTQGFDVLYGALVDAETASVISLLVRALLSFVLLAVPTSLMGATLPLLTEFLHRHPVQTRLWRVGILYSANTLGAAFGIFAASFFLIEWLGLHVTTVLAAALNFLVASIGLSLSRRSDVAALSDSVPVKSADGAVGVVVLALALSGAAAMASEVLWTRAVSTLIGNSTYAFATIVLVYLVGIAAGSAVFSRGFVRRISPHRVMVWLFLSMSGVVILGITAYSALWAGFLKYDGSPVDAGAILFLYFKVSALIFPLAFLSGAVFPVATRAIDATQSDASGAQIGRAYTWNTIGAVIGALAAGFLIAPSFDLLPSLYLVAASYAVFAIVIELRRGGSGAILGTMNGRVALAAVVGLLAYSFVNLNQSPTVGTLVRLAKDWDVPFHRPGMQGIVSVLNNTANSRMDRLLVNGHGMTVKVTDTKMMAHLPLLAHPDPQDTLVICFGMGTTFRSALSHGGRVTVVELVPEVLDAFAYYHADAKQVLADPNGRRIANDGRNFLKMTRQRFDVITLDPPPPIDAAGVNHLYSADFLALAKSRLKPGGVLAHWVPMPNTGGGVDDPETFRVLVKTFASSFRYVLAKRGMNGLGLHLIGSDSPIDWSAERLRQRLELPRVKADISEWNPVLLPAILPVVQVSADSPEFHRLAVVTDDRPRLEFYLLDVLMNGRKKSFFGPDFL